MTIDYAAMQREFPKQKAALTRAIKTGDLDQVIATTRETIAQWEANGGVWPDDWARWQRALDDVAVWPQHIDMTELVGPKPLLSPRYAKLWADNMPRVAGSMYFAIPGEQPIHVSDAQAERILAILSEGDL